MTTILTDEDERWFAQYPRRQWHIRKAWLLEQAGEFMSLGFHDPERRRILMWKVPKGTPFMVGQIMKVPFLQFADETIQDTDAYLGPIWHQVMQDAAKEHGIPVPKMRRA